ncbi:GTPase ObgE [Candidatus Roizmanbacteria bacterium]|nr:GTPase ObgE [Candidatus Roizmanbacteria bacterium]
MFIDEIEVSATAGHGGPGKVSFFPGYRTSPDGGIGGSGGSVYFKVNHNLATLAKFTQMRAIKAEHGYAGQSNLCDGKKGADLFVDVPPGTAIIDLETQQEEEVPLDGTPLLWCKGGKGGRGNASFKSSRHTAPRTAQPGLPGETRRVKLIMRLIADYGLIGLPNAGKSSLLNEITAAKVKTAAYAFTTLEPNLATLHGTVLADIPGLIEGASSGRGLGIKFLKHIEKVKMLLHCISSESDNLKRDYLTIRQELGQFNPALLEKPEHILLTKSDLISPSELKKIIRQLKAINAKVLVISIHDADALDDLKKLLT